jgi:maleylpyruvate isomerase
VRPLPEVREEVAGSRAAHAVLLDDLATLTDAEARRPSLLPGWSVGHVVTHLARNADSHRRLFEAAAAGRSAERYPGGRTQRAQEIEGGAGRPAALLVDDLRRACEALELTWDECRSWEAAGTHQGSVEPLAELPFKRWREVEIHHADLGRAFTMDSWSSGYVRRELRRAEMAWRASQPIGLTGLPAAALALPPNRRLAWLAGRFVVDGLPDPPTWL